MIEPPRAWSTGDAGSFARDTLSRRVPAILDDTVRNNPGLFKDDARALREELTSGSLRGLVEDAPDRAAWDDACAPHVGKSWLAIPWYFAEAFFYRRLLEASGYAHNGIDPFVVVKLAEERTGIPRARAILDEDPPLAARLLHALWGNRADLSYAVGLAHGSHGTSDDLLVDDSKRALALLQKENARVAIVLDNAGTELAFDLVLASALVHKGAEVTLFAKAHPFFVSDATPVDVERTRVALGVPKQTVVAHPFMTSSGFLRTRTMPADLVAALRAFDVVISKGDANYRRLLADAPWPHATAFDDAIDFPTALIALRTCKAEVAVGVPDDVVTRARSVDERWLVSGRFGMIQSSSGNGP